MVNFHNRREPSVVSRPAAAPRSYLVDTPTGTVRRNRHPLVTLPYGVTNGVTNRVCDQ